MPRICEINAAVLDAHLEQRSGAVVERLEDVLEADAWARERARAELCRSAPRTRAVVAAG